jgi:hypothetical protein
VHRCVDQSAQNVRLTELKRRSAHKRFILADADPENTLTWWPNFTVGENVTLPKYPA